MSKINLHLMIIIVNMVILDKNQLFLPMKPTKLFAKAERPLPGSIALLTLEPLDLPRELNKNEPIDQLCVFLWLDDPSGHNRLELLLAKHRRLHVCRCKLWKGAGQANH